MASNAQLQIVIDAQNNASKELKKLNDDVGSLGSISSSVFAAVGTVAKVAAVGVAALGGSIAAAGVSSLKSATNFEQYSIAFETMLGNADKAKTLMNDIVETAKKTPFQLDELVVSSKQLLAYGFAQEDVIKTTTMLGDVSAGLNLNLSDMAWLYGTTRVQGRLFSKDLYQFTNRGIPLTAQLAKQFGVTEGEVQKLVEAGKVGFPEVEKAFQEMTGEGGQFYNLMLKQSTTLGGLMSNLKDSFSILGMEIVGVSATGEIIKGGLFDKIKEGAIVIYDWIEKNKQIIQDFASKALQLAIQKVQEWYSFIIDNKDKIITFAQTVFDGFMSIVSSVRKLFDESSTVYQFVTTVFLPSFLSMRDTIMQVWNDIVTAIQPIKPELKYLAEFFGVIIVGTLIVLVKTYAAVIGTMIRIFGGLIEAVSGGIQFFEGLFSALFSFILGDMGSAIDGMKKMWEGFKSFVVGVAKVIFSPFQNAFNTMIDAIIETWNRTIGGKGFSAPDWVPKFGGKEFTIPKLPNRAVGGSLTSGKPYLVGENGPEMFIPASNGRIEKNPAKGGGVNIVFNNPVVRNDADIDNIIRLVKQSIGRDQELNRINAF